MPVEVERLIEIAREAAPHLTGKAWRYNGTLSEKHSNHGRRRIIISDSTLSGKAICLSQDLESPSRIAIRGELPPFAAGRTVDFTSKISVSTTRSGRAIAGDINRRLLPDYMSELDERKEQLRLQKLANEDFLQKLHLLQHFVPSLKPSNRNDPLNSGEFRFEIDGLTNGGRVVMYKSYDRTKLELSLSYDKLIKLFALLPEL